MNKIKYFCGIITIIGKTNVGKSTLLNKIIKKKISIISYKKNTTQKNIKGIITKKNYQYIYIDTPGIIYNKKKIYISKKEINNTDIIIFVVQAMQWNNEDQYILNVIKKVKKPILLIINKIDIIIKKNTLLPYLKLIKKKNFFIEIIPISAHTGENINILIKKIKYLLPKKKHIYNNKKISTQSKKFFISEIIREQFIKKLKNELPYKIKIKIENIKKNNLNYIIHAILFIKKKKYKKIILGKNGNMIKTCSILSKNEIQKIIKKKIHLYIHIIYNKNIY